LNPAGGVAIGIIIGTAEASEIEVFKVLEAAAALTGLKDHHLKLFVLSVARIVIYRLSQLKAELFIVGIVFKNIEINI